MNLYDWLLKNGYELPKDKVVIFAGDVDEWSSGYNQSNQDWIKALKEIPYESPNDKLVEALKMILGYSMTAKDFYKGTIGNNFDYIIKTAEQALSQIEAPKEVER